MIAQRFSSALDSTRRLPLAGRVREVPDFLAELAVK
jgi:hypothetical protein